MAERIARREISDRLSLPLRRVVALAVSLLPLLGACGGAAPPPIGTPAPVASPPAASPSAAAVSARATATRPPPPTPRPLPATRTPIPRPRVEVGDYVVTRDQFGNPYVVGYLVNNGRAS